MDSIGRLVCDGTPLGTAFLVSSTGLAATAAHVLAGYPDADWTFEPLTAPGLSLPVDTTLPVDSAADIALVRILGRDADRGRKVSALRPMPLASHTSATPGDLVHLSGFAGTRAFDSGVGHYVGETADAGRSWIKVSCQHAQPGMSGAPVVLTGTGCVIGLVSARVNAARWNRDTVQLARTEDLVALAPHSLRLSEAPRDFANGTLRLSWIKGDVLEPVMESDDFHVSIGRSAANRLQLPDGRDSRFHGHLSLIGATLTYQHLGSRPACLLGPARQLTLANGDSCPVGDKDRLQFGSGMLLVEFSAPDLYDPNAVPTAPPDIEAQRHDNRGVDRNADGATASPGQCSRRR